MRVLSKKEWIAVTLAIVVVVLFLGARFFMDFTSSNSTIANINATTGSLDTTKSNPITSPDQNINNDATNTNSTNNMAANLIVKDVKVGTGAEAKAGDLVSVNYTGKFADGKVFDSSIPRGQPFQFTLGAGQVIAGWDQGVAGMKVGGERTLVIPPSLGYGANGYPPVIPPNSTLYFDVTLTAVQNQ